MPMTKSVANEERHVPERAQVIPDTKVHCGVTISEPLQHWRTPCTRVPMVECGASETSTRQT